MLSLVFTPSPRRCFSRGRAGRRREEARGGSLHGCWEEARGQSLDAGTGGEGGPRWGWKRKGCERAGGQAAGRGRPGPPELPRGRPVRRVAARGESARGPAGGGGGGKAARSPLGARGRRVPRQHAALALLSRFQTGSARLSVTCCRVPGWRSEVSAPPPVPACGARRSRVPESALRKQGGRLVQVRGGWAPGCHWPPH